MVSLLSFGLTSAFPEEVYSPVSVMEVVSVYDGDTFKVDIEGYPAIIGDDISIRINGIDTPEIRGTSEEIKAKAYQARDYLEDRLKGASQIELRNPQRGKYFRIIADVYLDGVNVAEELISLGYAKPYDGGTRPEW